MTRPLRLNIEIGQASGGVDYAAVSDVLRRYERALSSGRTLRREKVNINRRFLNLDSAEKRAPDGEAAVPPIEKSNEVNH